MSEASEDDWVEVKRFGARAEADQHALVLVAVGLDCRVVPDGGSIGLFVRPSDAMRARRELAAYTRENARPRPAPQFPSTRGFGDGIDGALAYCAVLMFLFAAARREALSLDWLAAGAARAGRIAGGEVWLAVTALGLHVEAGHLMGNLAAGVIFGILLAQPLGPGLAWLAILVAGTAGNVLSALVQAPGHTAIGASTAVFAALGILAALEWRRRAGTHRGLRYWAPLVAGVALLGFLGVGGERTDVGAHVGGFAAGVVTGIGLARVSDRLSRARSAQWRYTAAASGLFVVAWLLAFATHG